MTARSKRSRIAGALTVVLSLAALAPLAPTARAQAPGLASGFANSGVLDDVVQPPAQTAPAAQAPAPTQTSGPKPNIVFIMGDDIGFMQPHIYHRGLMVGETPNIDRIGRGRDLHGLRRHAELHLRPQCLLHRHVSVAHGISRRNCPAARPICGPEPRHSQYSC